MQICFFAFFSEIFFLLDELIQQVKVETSPEDKESNLISRKRWDEERMLDKSVKKNYEEG